MSLSQRNNSGLRDAEARENRISIQDPRPQSPTPSTSSFPLPSTDINAKPTNNNPSMSSTTTRPAPSSSPDRPKISRPHPHLRPVTTTIPRSKIQKKWKPLPASAREKIQLFLSTLNERRSDTWHNNATVIKANSRAGTKRTRAEVEEDEYRVVVEDVVAKYVSPLSLSALVL